LFHNQYFHKKTGSCPQKLLTFTAKSGRIETEDERSNTKMSDIRPISYIITIKKSEKEAIDEKRAECINRFENGDDNAKQDYKKFVESIMGKREAEDYFAGYAHINSFYKKEDEISPTSVYTQTKGLNEDGLQDIESDLKEKFKDNNIRWEDYSSGQEILRIFDLVSNIIVNYAALVAHLEYKLNQVKEELD
jgi:hypothetical protein